MFYAQNWQTDANKQILYRLILTAPITLESSERTFCKLKLIKIVMRTCSDESGQA